MSTPYLDAHDSPARSVTPPAPAPARDTPAGLDPLPWPGLSKAECVLLAIALSSGAGFRVPGK